MGEERRRSCGCAGIRLKVFLWETAKSNANERACECRTNDLRQYRKTKDIVDHLAQSSMHVYVRVTSIILAQRRNS